MFLRKFKNPPAVTGWVLLLLSVFLPVAAAAPFNDQSTITAVEAIGMTVSGMDGSIEFYTNVLTFHKISDVEVWGSEYEHLQGCLVCACAWCGCNSAMRSSS